MKSEGAAAELGVEIPNVGTVCLTPESPVPADFIFS
jgi:hypothetical protein